MSSYLSKLCSLKAIGFSDHSLDLPFFPPGKVSIEIQIMNTQESLHFIGWCVQNYHGGENDSRADLFSIKGIRVDNSPDPQQ